MYLQNTSQLCYKYVYIHIDEIILYYIIDEIGLTIKKKVGNLIYID